MYMTIHKNQWSHFTRPNYQQLRDSFSMTIPMSHALSNEFFMAK